MERKLASTTSISAAEALAHGRRLLAAQPRLAEEQARAILEADPHHAGALRLVGAALRQGGDEAAARTAEAQAIAAHDPEAAADAMRKHLTSVLRATREYFG